MKTIHICKADLLHNQKPEEVTIIIDREIPEFHPYKNEAPEQWYQGEAETLIDALYLALPQGTFDRLGIEFMKKKISLYRGITNE